jgi:O-antigen ligase
MVVLYAVQSLYSGNLEHALKNVCFFFVPFAVLFRLVAELEWTRARLQTALGVSVGVALLSVTVGLFEYATRHLLIFNSKVLLANEIKPYFRVNSLFFDPNIYGRFVALTMVALAGTLLWRRRDRDVWLIAGALVLMWAGLVVSLSESSFASLLVGLACLAAVRWRPGPVLAVAAAGVAALAALVAVSPGTLGIKTHSFSGVNQATSGRAALVRSGLDMARDRPVAGYGSGSFSDQYRQRKHLLSKNAPAESHTIPVTVAAEQGAIGLVAYAAVVIAAFMALFEGLRAAARRGPAGHPDGARMIVAATFAALFVHTLVYAAFLEDPLTWTLLALGAALRHARSGNGEPGHAARPGRVLAPA